MSAETYTLEDAREQLQRLIDAFGGLEQTAPPLRSAPEELAPVLLSAGVMQYDDFLVWYSLTARIDDDRHDPKPQVAFELELSTDLEVPAGMLVLCVIGRSRVERAVERSTVLTWRAGVTDVLNRRTQRVEAVTLSLVPG